MSGWPSPRVRHIYRRIGSGLVTNYSTIGGICKICPPVIPPPPPPPPANIEFGVFSAIPYSVTFYLGGGSGTYDLGNGVSIPFSTPSTVTAITGTVPVGATVKIYSNDIQQFSTNNEPVLSLDVSNCPTLTSLQCNQSSPGQSYLTGAFDISGNPNLTQVNFENTLISSLSGVTSCPDLIFIVLTGAAFTQETADELANDLITNQNSIGGVLQITTQSTGSIDITGFLYVILSNTYGWTIT